MYLFCFFFFFFNDTATTEIYTSVNTLSLHDALPIYQFSPVTLTVSVGATVTWQNGDGGAHTVTNATGSADTYDLNLPAGGTASHLFNTAGTYNYYCKNHGINGAPPTGMHGTITVQ